MFNKRSLQRMKNETRNRQKGAAALEFALLAPVFLALMFSICEIGWVNFAKTVAERANNEAARKLRTGQIQSIDISEDADAQKKAVYDELCRFAVIFGSCEEKIFVEVQTFTSFEDLAEDNSPIVCRDSSQSAQDDASFDSARDSAIVRIRTCILYKTLNPAIGLSLARSNGHPDRLMTQFLFRVEPFERNDINDRT